MTPEVQRMAIAAACGITEIHREVPRGRTVEFWTGMRGDNFRSVFVPDYLSDLNAMHEAEKSIPCDNIYKYGTWLTSAVLDISVIEAYEINLRQGNLQAVIRATAAQRAEAFLKAIGKWAD